MQVETDNKGLLVEAAQALKDLGATAVYVFGSTTRGHQRKHSDVDLAVEGLPPTVFFKAIARTSRILGRPVDLVDLDKDDEFTGHLRRSGDLKNLW
ncbi:MAG: nucleotidyltransferase domain-containing protein [Planctomycetaceae bacterium]|nr:nucleotidyltransferase domain-containing protein [Planctomycetaceae bacterium]